MRKAKLVLLLVAGTIFVSDALAATITVYGSGGVRRRRICPKPPALVCATIETESAVTPGNSNGAVVLPAPTEGYVKVFDGNGNVVREGRAEVHSIGPNGHGADITFK